MQQVQQPLTKFKQTNQFMLNSVKQYHWNQMETSLIILMNAFKPWKTNKSDAVIQEVSSGDNTLAVYKGHF